MTIRNALNAASSRLEGADVPDALLDAEYLLAHVLGLTRLEMKLLGARPLPMDQTAAFETVVQRRMAREPLQYLMGYEMFMGLRIKTDARALIPRPETELLCEKALQAIASYPAPQRVLDLCTGTGAVGLSLKVGFPDMACTLSDLSGDALSLARENATALGVDAAFRQGDLLCPIKGETPFHVIVCNPPYIRDEDCLHLQTEVQKEPMMALKGGGDGLDFYKRLSREAKDHLVPGGTLLMEIGYDQGQSVPALFAPFYHSIAVYQDLGGQDRVVSVKR